MKIFRNPVREQWAELCSRPTQGNSDIEARVEDIIRSVRENGDGAILKLALEIDKVELKGLKVTPEEFEEAAKSVNDDTKAAIETAYANIRAFHKAQMPGRIEVETAPGVRCIQKPVPIRRVGLYIPGGTAPLFSTVLMLAVPSEIAGCPKRILCTPAGRDGKVNPTVLYTATRCGISEVFKIGGAQAIAAMAYGTQTVPAVDKIFGPGNRYVTTAKKLVSTDGTAIDMQAGPSEVMVLADRSAEPSFVAADLLSQAEHGRDSQVILVCTDESIAEKVLEEVDRQAALLPRGELIGSSLENSRAVVFTRTEDILDFADEYAPEHLIISMENAAELAEQIECAGSVFVGNFSPESAGDYASGTNHTLPTSGWARSCGGVNIDSFIRKMTIQNLSEAGIHELAKCITIMADAEGLSAHAAAVTIRTSNGKAEPEPFNLSSVIRPNIATLAPYSTARDDYQGAIGTFLDANESPYENGVNRYPDPRQKLLKSEISKVKGFPVENIFIGNGSDEAIDLMFRVFCNPGRDNAVAICPSYGMYKVAAATNDIELREVYLNKDFSLDSKALLDSCDPQTKLIFLCSPNNPSGNSFPREQMLEIAEKFRGILVIDEAYLDFAGQKTAALSRPNIVVLQTLSKAWGMAGLRLGLAIADSRIIRLMSMVKYPYNINKTAQETAMQVLQFPIIGRINEIREEREKLQDILPRIPIVKKVWPSDANFLLVVFDDPDSIYSRLVESGVIVRNRNTTPLCKGCLRITVGTPEENKRLIEILRSI